MLIPIAYLVASRLYRDDLERNSLLMVAHGATIVMLISVLASATHLAERVFEPVAGQAINFLLATFFLEAAVFYAALAVIRKHAAHVFMTAAMAGAAVWQVLNYFQTGAEVYMICFGTLGLGLLIGARYMKARLGAGASQGLIGSTLIAGDAMLTISFLASSLMVASRLITHHAVWGNAGLLALMTLLTLSAAVIVLDSAWRRAYIVMSLINGTLAFILLGALSTLSGWQKAEVFAVGAGLLMLVIGHVGWYREQQTTSSDTVSFNLAIGSVLATVPLFIAAVVNRFGYEVSLADEIALVTIASLLLISGLMLQLRATTLCGGILLAMHIVVLLAFAGWKAQLAVGVYLAMGGALVFFSGLVLAIYREQLLLLPQKIQRREGVFKVLAWR
jgi:hypothetical protein